MSALKSSIAKVEREKAEISKLREVIDRATEGSRLAVFAPGASNVAMTGAEATTVIEALKQIIRKKEEENDKNTRILHELCEKMTILLKR